MKNFRTFCASADLVLYALLAGASIDDNGDFEGWFIALCIIIPIVIIIAVIWMFSAENARKEEGRRKIPKNYVLEFANVLSNNEFYYNSQDKKVLALVYDTSNHKIAEVPNVEKSNSFQYSHLYFVVDENNKKIVFINANINNIRVKTIFFNEIQGIDISEDGTSVFNKSTSSVVGRALVGGLLFGGVGAVVGGVTGKSKEKKTLNSYKVTIQLSDINNPTHEIEFVTDPIESGTTVGDEMMKQIKACANKLKSVLTAIIKVNEIQLNLQQAKAQVIMQAEMQQKVLESKGIAALEEKKNTSIADELLKLSELHKNGGLTNEEYEALKKRLL